MKKGLLGGCVIIVLSFVGLRWYSASFFSHQRSHYSQTGILSSDCFSRVSEMVNDLLIKKCSAHSIIKKVQDQIPVIADMTIAYRPGITCLAITGYKPRCIINDTVVLTEKNELCNKNYFNSKVLIDIPAIIVAQDFIPYVASFLSSRLNFLPSKCTASYDLELINEHYIRLSDKKDEQFMIISLLDQDISDALSHCAQIKENIKARKEFNKKIGWVTDTRFKPYIVAYKV